MTKPRKRGRPKLPKSDLKCVRIPVRIKSQDDVALKQAAEAAGMKYSDYLRSKILS